MEKALLPFPPLESDDLGFEKRPHEPISATFRLSVLLFWAVFGCLFHAFLLCFVAFCCVSAAFRLYVLLFWAVFLAFCCFFMLLAAFFAVFFAFLLHFCCLSAAF